MGVSIYLPIQGGSLRFLYYVHNYIALKIIFGVYTRCEQIDVFKSMANSSVRKIYILRPNRDQLRKMQLQGLPAGNLTRDPGSLDQRSTD